MSVHVHVYRRQHSPLQLNKLVLRDSATTAELNSQQGLPVLTHL